MPKFKVEWKVAVKSGATTRVTSYKEVIESENELKALQAVLMDPTGLEFLTIRKVAEKEKKQ